MALNISQLPLTILQPMLRYYVLCPAVLHLTMYPHGGGLHQGVGVTNIECWVINRFNCCIELSWVDWVEFSWVELGLNFDNFYGEENRVTTIIVGLVSRCSVLQSRWYCSRPWCAPSVLISVLVRLPTCEQQILRIESDHFSDQIKDCLLGCTNTIQQNSHIVNIYEQYPSSLKLLFKKKKKIKRKPGHHWDRKVGRTRDFFEFLIIIYRFLELHNLKKLAIFNDKMWTVSKCCSLGAT